MSFSKDESSYEYYPITTCCPYFFLEKQEGRSLFVELWIAKIADVFYYYEITSVVMTDPETGSTKYLRLLRFNSSPGVPPTYEICSGFFSPKDSILMMAKHFEKVFTGFYQRELRQK